MNGLFAASCPLKISVIVVFLFAVFVINRGLIFWIWDERLGNQPAYHVAFRLIVFAQVYNLIATMIKEQLKKMAF